MFKEKNHCLSLTNHFGQKYINIFDIHITLTQREKITVIDI